DVNVADAKKIRAEYSTSPLQSLVYDGADPSAALVAQRIAVNARDAGINLSVSAETAANGGANNFDVRLVRWRISAPDAREALTALFRRLNGAQAEAAFMPLETPEQRFAAERAGLDRGRIIPVAFVAWGVSTYTQREFEKIDQHHTDALTEQFKQEYAQRGEEVVHRVTGIKESDATISMAIALSGPRA